MLDLIRHTKEVAKMTWFCPHCGKENECEDRIALKEPRCARCGQERADPGAVSIALVAEKAKVRQAREALVVRLATLSNQIVDLESEIATLTALRAVVKEEHRACVQAEADVDARIERLAAIVRGERPRVVTADQASLGGYVGEEEA